MVISRRVQQCYVRDTDREQQDCRKSWTVNLLKPLDAPIVFSYGTNKRRRTKPTNPPPTSTSTSSTTTTRKESYQRVPKTVYEQHTHTHTQREKEKERERECAIKVSGYLEYVIAVVISA